MKKRMEHKRVLVIENRRDLQEALTAIFTRGSYIVANAATHEEGLQKLLEGTWDIVVVDMISRSSIQGRDLLEAYTSNPASLATQNPVFIAVADDEDEAARVRPLVDSVFVAPNFTPGEVLETVEQCLQKRQHLQAAPKQV